MLAEAVAHFGQVAPSAIWAPQLGQKGIGVSLRIAEKRIRSVDGMQCLNGANRVDAGDVGVVTLGDRYCGHGVFAMMPAGIWYSRRLLSYLFMMERA